MTDLPADHAHPDRAHPEPRPSAEKAERTGRAPLKGIHDALPQVVLLWAGAILLPLGIAIMIGCWWGTANTPYEYDQLSYLAGGLIGLGLTLVGGFLYFASWMARVASDVRDSSKRIADAMLFQAQINSTAPAITDLPPDAGPVLVIAGAGRTIHRSDCALIARREDLVPVGAADRAQLSRCRVCQPEV